MSNDLRNALRKEADRLADEFYERAMSLISAQVAGMFSGVEAPKPKAEKTEPAAEEETVLAAIVDVLKKHPAGLRFEGIRAELPTYEKRDLGLAVRLGLESDQITKSGQRRATTYRLPKRR